MKLTNRLNLPQAIFDAVKNDGYSNAGADASVTELIGPPRQAALKRKHWSELTEDVSDRIWSLLGQSIHTILERANRVSIAERRLSIEIDGWKISGGMDLYEEDGTLVDYKTTSAWSCKGGAKNEWEQQLNLYAEILRANGQPVNNLRVIAILRDWSKLEAVRSPDYPQLGVIKFDIPLWPQEQAQAYLRERVRIHQEARKELPRCTAQERWAKPDVYAVMKQARKSAVRLYPTEAEAHNHAGQAGSDHYVVKRPGENVRCTHYCPVSEFCIFFQAMRAAKVPETEEVS